MVKDSRMDVRIRLKTQPQTQLGRVLTHFRMSQFLDLQSTTENLLITCYLVHALIQNKGGRGIDEVELQQIAHESIGILQGHIRAIQNAAGLDTDIPMSKNKLGEETSDLVKPQESNDNSFDASDSSNDFERAEKLFSTCN